MQTRFTWSLGTALLLASPLVIARGAALTPHPTPSLLSQEEGDLDGQVEDLIEEFDEAKAEFWRLYRAAETDEAKDEVYDEYYPDADETALLLVPIIEEAPASSAALTAIVWTLENANLADRRAQNLAILLEHHKSSSDLGRVCSALGREVAPDAEHFLRELMAQSESREVQGRATFALANLLGSRIELSENIGQVSEEDLPQWVEFYGEEAIALSRTADRDALAAERKELFVKVRDEFADIETRRGTLGDAAGAQLFELERLQIGMTAPEIEGDDLDGASFKLSDYRGQVVFLDFWGDW